MTQRRPTTDYQASCGSTRVGPYRFGPFTLDPHTLELHHSGRPVPLEPLPTRILIRLLERPGTMVSRCELRALGWPSLPDAAEQSLNTCIRQIREALGDSAADPKYVETLRGRGYRFAADVVTAGPRQERKRRGWLGTPYARVAAVATAVVIAGTAFTTFRAERRADGPQSRAGEATRPRNPELAGRMAKARFLHRDHQNLPLAIALLDTVLDSQPDLAEAHGLRAELLLLEGRLDESGRAARSAMQLDPREPHGIRAFAGLRMLEGDWPRAEALLQDALRHGSEDPGTRAALAFLYTVRGRFEDAEHQIELARLVSPLSPLLLSDAGLMYFWAGRYGRAEALCRETLQLRPERAWALGCLFDAQARSGRAVEAASTVREIYSRYGVAAPGPDTDARAIVAQYRRWRVESWERAVDAGTASPFGLAVAYADLGRTEEALAALERAALQPTLGILTLAVDPRFGSLAGSPRYEALLRRYGLDHSIAAAQWTSSSGG